MNSNVYSLKNNRSELNICVLIDWLTFILQHKLKTSFILGFYTLK
jgi:hypothetical protein